MILLSDVNECASNPCHHGGMCTDLVNGYICTCVVGYAGVNCKTGIVICYREGRVVLKQT